MSFTLDRTLLVWQFRHGRPSKTAKLEAVAEAGLRGLFSRQIGITAKTALVILQQALRLLDGDFAGL